MKNNCLLNLYMTNISEHSFLNFFFCPDERLDTLKLEQEEKNFKYHFLLKEVKEKFSFCGVDSYLTGHIHINDWQIKLEKIIGEKKHTAKIHLNLNFQSLSFFRGRKGTSISQNISTRHRQLITQNNFSSLCLF